MPEPEWDGVTIQWFDSAQAFYDHMKEDDFPAMMEDTDKFLDMTKTQFVITEEPTIVIS
jgi:predicted membrane protein